MATTIGAVAVALVISGLLIAVIGGDPINIGRHILQSSFGNVGVLSDTLVKATPLIFTGLACALAFRMRLWNIGAEGQLFMGAWGASAVVLVPLVPADSSPFVVIPAMLVAGIAAGALWGGLAGWLKARFNVNDDDQHPDAQLHRHPVGPLLGLRTLERGRLPARRVSHAAHGCRG